MRSFKKEDYMALGSIPDGESVRFLILGGGSGQQLIPDGGSERLLIPVGGSGQQMIPDGGSRWCLF